MGKRNNSIIISGVLVAFLIGTMVSGPQAIAAPGDKGQPFEALQAAIEDLQTQIDSITAGAVDWSAITGIPTDFADEIDNVDDADADSTNELQAISLSGNDLTLSDGGGTVTLPAGGGSGDITAVTAGTGLTGGATSGDATLNADINFLQKRVIGGCADNQHVTGISSDGTLFCGANSGDIASVTAGTGLTGGATFGTATLNVDTGTTAFQIVQLDGSARLPAVDGSQLTGISHTVDTVLDEIAVDGFVANNGYSTGTGTSGKIAFWTSSSGLSSDTNLDWDAAINTLTIPSGELKVNGDIETSGDYTYSSAKTRTMIIPYHEAVAKSGDEVRMFERLVHLVPFNHASGTGKAFLPVVGLPDGATLTRLDCGIRDISTTVGGTYECSFVRQLFGTNSISTLAQASITTNAAFSADTVISDTTFPTSGSEIVNPNYSYYIEFKFTGDGTACNNSCGSFFSPKVTYTVTKAD